MRKKSSPWRLVPWEAEGPGRIFNDFMARLKLLRRSSGQAKPFQIQDPLADQVEERPFQGRESIAFDDLRPLGPAGLKSLEFYSFAALKGRSST